MRKLSVERTDSTRVKLRICPTKLKIKIPRSVNDEDADRIITFFIKVSNMEGCPTDHVVHGKALPHMVFAKGIHLQRNDRQGAVGFYHNIIPYEV